MAEAYGRIGLRLNRADPADPPVGTGRCDLMSLFYAIIGLLQFVAKRRSYAGCGDHRIGFNPRFGRANFSRSLGLIRGRGRR